MRHWVFAFAAGVAAGFGLTTLFGRGTTGTPEPVLGTTSETRGEGPGGPSPDVSLHPATRTPASDRPPSGDREAGTAVEPTPTSWSPASSAMITTLDDAMREVSVSLSRSDASAYFDAQFTNWFQNLQPPVDGRQREEMVDYINRRIYDLVLSERVEMRLRGRVSAEVTHEADALRTRTLEEVHVYFIRYILTAEQASSLSARFPLWRRYERIARSR